MLTEMEELRFPLLPSSILTPPLHQELNSLSDSGHIADEQRDKNHGGPAQSSPTSALLDQSALELETS
jgi:hypothetical protein